MSVATTSDVPAEAAPSRVAVPFRIRGVGAEFLLVQGVDLGSPYWSCEAGVPDNNNNREAFFMIGSNNFVRCESRVRKEWDSSTTTTLNFRCLTALATCELSVKSE